MSSDFIDWPETLPLPLIGVSVNNNPINIRTQMESGRIRMRRMNSSTKELWKVSWNLTEDQYADFKAFFETDLTNGSENFEIDLFGVRATVTFSESTYTWTREDSLFTVSAVLEVISYGTMDLLVTATGLSVGEIVWGTTKSYTFTVSNLGTLPAVNTFLEVTLSPYFSFISATDGAEPESDGVIRFALDTVIIGDDRVLVVTFACNGGEGAVSSFGFVTSDSADDDYSNNAVLLEEVLGIAAPVATDDFETYTVGQDLEDLNGGQRWAAAYADRGILYVTTDDFETYNADDDLDTLNSGLRWTAGYASRTTLYFAEDDFEAYIDGASLNAANSGTKWTAAFESR